MNAIKMTPSFFTRIQDQKFILIFLSAVFLLCLREGVIFCADTGTYIGHSLVRIGLYPLAISYFKLLFKEHGLQALVCFQLIFALSTSYYLATFLRSTFNLPRLLHWILIFTFLSPVIVRNSANEIMSEGLAYPLFLLASLSLLKGILKKDLQNLYVFSFVIFLLCFTRQQYLFFYGVAISSLIFFLLFEKQFQKKSQFFLSIVLSLGSFFIAERACHYFFHESFSKTPFIGSQLVVRPLLLAADESYKVFDDPKQRQLVKETIEEIIDQKLVNPDPAKRDIDQYAISYGAIALVFVTLRAKIWPEASFQADPQENPSTFQYAQILDQHTINISFKLIKNNFSNYLKSYTKDVMRGFGGYIFFGFVIFVAFLCFWRIFWFNSKNSFHISFILFTLIHLGNLVIICIFEPPLTRYIYSSSLLLLSILLIMGYQFTKEDLLNSDSCNTK